MSGAGVRETVDDAVTRAKAGDEEAFRHLYVTFVDNVRGYVGSMLRSPEDADDVTQQVFVRLMSAIGRYERRDATFLSWLLRIAHNAAIDHMRRRRDHGALHEGEVAAAPRLPELERRELVLALAGAFEDLPDDQRQILLMRHVSGLSPREIARELGRSTGSVDCMHHRARKNARRTLEAAGIAPAA